MSPPSRKNTSNASGASRFPRPTSPSADARSLAQQCLEQVLLKDDDVQAVLDGLLRRHAPDPRDAGLATELVYGYLRLRLRCDFLVNRFLRKPKGTPPPLRILLGQCAYALTALERVPAYATVDWGVRAAKKRFGANLGGLSNAVLRRVSEAAASGEALEQGFYRQEREPQAAFLSRYYSCPQWLVQLWADDYGEETTLHWLRAQAQAPPVGIRLNRRHEEYATLAARLQQLPECLLAAPPGFAPGFASGVAPGVAPGIALSCASCLPELAELEVRGALSRQSLASLQTLQQLGAFGHCENAEQGWEGPVWDACCGHGGKCCALMEGGLSPVWCSDRSRRRIRGLRRELKRLDLPATPLFMADASKPPLFRGDAGPKTILVDAPCSGLGVLSRRPDAKWRRTMGDVEQLAGLQARILKAGAELLPPGGRLCYVTCTLTPQENEGQLKQLLQQRPELRLEREWRTPPDSALREFFYGFVLRS